MKYIEGDTVFGRLTDPDEFDEKNIKYIMKQLLEMLEYLDKKNIMHRDIKIDNLIFRNKKSWDLVLIDFGFAEST